MRRDLGVLRETVISFSESDFWEDAVSEWEIVGCDIDETMKSTCICGQEGLKYCFEIHNVLNDNVLYPIGSSCINQFGRSDLRQMVTLYEQLFHIRTKYYNREKIVLSDFSRNLLRFLLEEGVFPATAYNRFDPSVDYEFMLSMFNQRSLPSAKQQSKINAIIMNCVIPYIRRMER